MKRFLRRVLTMLSVIGLVYLHMLVQGKVHEGMERDKLFNNQGRSGMEGR